MEITNINDIERATRKGQREPFRLGMALLFIVGVMFYSWAQGGGSFLMMMAALLAGTHQSQAFHRVLRQTLQSGDFRQPHHP